MALNTVGDALIHVEGRDNVADVLEIALHNASFKYLGLRVYPDGVLLMPNKSALEIEELDLYASAVASADVLVAFVARFRKVQVIRFNGCQNIADFSPVIDLCRQNGIRSVTNGSNGADLVAEK